MAARPRYDGVAITLHWVIAMGILAQIAMGLTMVHLAIPLGLKFQLYQLHKSIGITILLAALLRVLWRFSHAPPALPEAMPALERRAASWTHLALYLFMLAMPLTGWALATVSPFHIPTVLYGLIPWPDMPLLTGISDQALANGVLNFLHDKLGYVLIALAALHVLAALRHHFLLRDNVLRRMLPF